MNKYSRNRLVSCTSLFITSFVMGVCSPLVYGKEYFNPNALSHVDELNIADLSSLEQFSSSDSQLPGVYNVNVIVNDTVIGVSAIDFVLNDNNQLEPVLTKQILMAWGVKANIIPTLKNLPDDAQIIDIGNYIEFATTQFLFSQQVLNVSIPQIALNTNTRGRIDPDLFDQGIPAFILNYDFNGARSRYKNSSYQDSQFLSLRSGFNLGAWRLRNYSTYEHNDNKNSWNSIDTYLSRDIQTLNSQLTIGEATTNSDIFSGFQFKGIRLESDESMLPYGSRGFAPVVRGFAQSNAKVTIRQNGSIIYQTYVAPGPFAIDDLYPTSYSGNLDVSVEEENGSEESFIVPFASLAIMQREGGVKYSATVGQYRSVNEGKTPNFLEGTLMYGLPWNTTLYGGTLLSTDHQSYALGIGFNFGDFGAISFDSKYALTNFDFDSATQRGHAYRFQYSKILENTDSTIALEVYKYSAKGFYDFNEANENSYLYSYLNNDQNKRSRYQVNFSQSLSQYGSIYISAYQQDYWHSSTKDRNINLGYNVVSNNISYGLSYGYNNSSRSQNSSHQVSLRINIPLGNWFSTNNYLTSSVSYAGHGKTTAQSGISGNALDNNLTYSIQQSYEQHNHYTGGNASIGYQGNSGYLNMGYAYTKYNERFDYGVQGGVVVHPYGITLSQSLNDTIALIAAPGASDVLVQNTQGVKTNSWGYAVKPYLSPYAENQITLNIDGLGDDIDIVNNTVSTFPTKGAVILAKIETFVGYRVLMSLTINGKPLPFGTIVTLTDSENSGIVGDNGEVYLSGMPAQGAVTAKWGQGDNQECKFDYQLPDNIIQQSVKIIATECIQ